MLGDQVKPTMVLLINDNIIIICVLIILNLMTEKYLKYTKLPSLLTATTKS